ncbi:MAG: membrane protease subunit, stomatin/prohibitin [Firmicutes bacterium HGW-Firmicutes-1]|jgi:hypothetical protein|nr:MAG: membrane protease subunit, stomatin/prohibitin [Firmicutes bacterium HGW-Firmicutes-1]
MFGFRFIKFQPNEYVMRYAKGKLIKEGAGLSFTYYGPTTSMVVVPVGSKEVPFIFEEITSDFQSITIQGEISYRIADQKKIAGLMNFGYNFKKSCYISEDSIKLPQKIVNIVRVQTKRQIEKMSLREAIQSSEVLADTMVKALVQNGEIERFGIEVLSAAILAILPNKETSRALEADAREAILKKADEAIYVRRNAAIEQERIIKENELSTEIAIEEKKMQILDAQLESEKLLQVKKNELEEAQLQFEIAQEDKRKALVNSEVENAKIKADARIYEIAKSMEVINSVDSSTIKALASVGMDSSQLIAVAFQELAGNAAKIGEFNMSPELLQGLMRSK